MEQFVQSVACLHKDLDLFVLLIAQNLFGLLFKQLLIPVFVHNFLLYLLNIRLFTVDTKTKLMTQNPVVMK